MAGTIYFVSAVSGSNSNNGLHSTTQGTSANGPFKDIYMFNPGLDEFHNASNRNPSGDGQYIMYLKAGTYTVRDVDGAFIALRGPYGGPTRQKALIAYPGETPVIDTSGLSASANRGITWMANYAPYGRNSYFTFSKLSGTGGTFAIGLWGDFNRVVGCHFKNYLDAAQSGVVMVDNSQFASVYGNYFEHNGYNSDKHNIYIKTHADYGPGDKSVENVYVGWNEFADAYASDAHGGVIYVSKVNVPNLNKNTRLIYIHNNYFHDGNMDYIVTADGQPLVGEIYVYNNLFINGACPFVGALKADTPTQSIYFYNNLLYKTGAAGAPMVYVAQGDTHAYFKNNILYSTPGQQFVRVDQYGPSTATFSSDFDLYYGSSALPSGQGITVSNAVMADPRFVNSAAFDFHLLSDSPAKDAGTDSVSAMVTDDYEAIARPQNARYDIGAYESSGDGGSAISVSVNPTAATLGEGGTQQFSATVTGTGNSSVTWSRSPAVGTIASGLYTAPTSITSQQTITVTATSAQDPSNSGNATVTLTPPSGGGSSIRHMQTTGGSISGSSSIRVNINATQSGSLLIVGVSSTGGVSTATVTDDKGDVFTSAVQLSAPNGAGLRIFYAPNVAAGASAVTANVGYGSADLIVSEYSGVSSVTPLDKANAYLNAWLGGPSFTSGTTATTTGSELLWGFAANLQSDIPIWTAGTSWTPRFTANGVGSFAEDRLVTTAGEYAATGAVSGIGSSYQIGAAIVTFR